MSTQACTPPTGSRNPFTLDSGFKAINYTQIEQQMGFCSVRAYTVIGNTSAWSSQSIPFYLSFPPGLSLMDPLWKSCKAFEPGVLDPPQTLDKVAALMSPGASQTSRAAPRAKPTLSQVLVTPTLTTDYDGNNTSSFTVPQSQVYFRTYHWAAAIPKPLPISITRTYLEAMAEQTQTLE